MEFAAVCASHRLPVVSSFHTNFDQYSGHYGVGWAKGLIWRYLRWFHNCTRETFVPSYTTIAELERKGFERLALWRRGVDSEVFRPDRPGRNRGAARLGWSDRRRGDHVRQPDRAREERGLSCRCARDRGGGASRGDAHSVCR